MDSCIEIPLEPETLNDIIEKAKDYCLMHGMLLLKHEGLSLNRPFWNI